MIRTIRTRLFLGFLLCISIPAALGPVIYHYQQDRNALDTVSSAMRAAQLDLLRTEQFTRDFINFGQRDTAFFAGGNSDYLSRRLQAITAAYGNLEALRADSQPEFVAKIDNLVGTLDTYDWTFMQLAERLRERGFQDYGAVGRMRDAIHALEAQVEQDDLIVHMLSLRRNEKDYIIRNQPRYVDALVERASEFQLAIAAHPELDAASKAGLSVQLGAYVAIFQELVAIDTLIGVRGGAGLFEDLYDVEKKLDSDFARLETAVDAYARERTALLTRYLLLSIAAFAVFTLVIGSVLSRKLTAPLNQLSGTMQRYVESEFKQEVDLAALTKNDDEVGRIARDFGTLQAKITEYVSSIRKMAYFDMLTGAASRAYLNQRLNEMIASARRRGEGFTLFFVDLDKFKDVNDSLGHDAGDQLLIEIANRLTDAVRQCDFVARLGGDEFCILLEGLSDEADIAVVAERCIGRMQAPVTLSGKTFKPTGSIGIARFPADGTDADELMQAGDNAMYAAKVAGHHRFEFFRKEMSESAAERLTTAQELRKAFDKEEFMLQYQPVVDVRTGAVDGWEAIVHWQHPQRGMVPSGEFLPEIERLGLMNELGTWIIREACRQLAAWREQGLDNMRVSVDVAPRQLGDKNLFYKVSQALEENGVEPAQLELEVTEFGIQSSSDGMAALDKLKELGVRMTIDDFGTGYSSLGALKHLPVDRLKIDHSFVRDMAADAQDAVLLGTIMSLGHALRFEIVAEGVENLEQVLILQGLECDLAQGGFFSDALPPDAVPDIARKGFVDSGPNHDASIAAG